MTITACYNSGLKVEIVKELLPCYWELCGVDNVVSQLPQTKHECATSCFKRVVTVPNCFIKNL